MNRFLNLLATATFLLTIIVLGGCDSGQSTVSTPTTNAPTAASTPGVSQATKPAAPAGSPLVSASPLASPAIAQTGASPAISPVASPAAAASPASANPALNQAAAKPGSLVMGNGGTGAPGAKASPPPLPPNIMESVTKPLSREKFNTLPKETQEMILKATGGKIPAEMVNQPPKPTPAKK
ncbi:MAG: hypothetical protein ACKV2V_28440 [Blastocatellia bacterium]